MELHLFIVFAIPIVISLLITPCVIWLAKRTGAMDEPSTRKIHHHPIPRLGGVAIYASFFLSVGLLSLLDPELHSLMSLDPYKGVMLTIGLVLILGLGIFDDIRPRTPIQKLIVQLIAGTLVYLAGFRISTIADPLGKGLLDLGILEYPATLLWIVGITNAFNLIDGLDGLAAGVAAIACFTIGGISLLKNEMTTALLVLILAGALAGFLRYNFTPAKIFLGDSGSLFLGFALSVFSMQSSTKGSTAFAILVPILSLGLPIMDTLLSMARRLLRALLPEQARSKSFFQKFGSMFSPDNGHIHHRLMARGLSHRKVVLLLYLVSCAFGIGAFAITTSNNFGVSLVLVAVGAATVIGVQQLRYTEMAVLRNGILLPMYEWPFMKRSLFRGFLDLGFIVIAYVAAYWLRLHSEMSTQLEKQLLLNLTIVCGIQLPVFYFSGLYKGTFQYLGVGDVLKMVKAVALSIILTGIALTFLVRGQNAPTLSIVILDFYFLASLVVGTRISFHVLNYLFRRELRAGKRVIIYGANANGVLTLQQILKDDTLNMTPVGFLDDSPRLEGKRLNGFIIYGGHWKIPRLLRKLEVDEILLSGDGMKPEILYRLKQLARAHRIAIRKFSTSFEKISLEGQRPQSSQPPAVLAPAGERSSRTFNIWISS